jgi:hypothetical protein
MAAVTPRPAVRVAIRHSAWRKSLCKRGDERGPPPVGGGASRMRRRSKEGLRQLEEALDIAGVGEERDHEARAIRYGHRRRQDAIEEPAEPFGEDRMVPGQAGFRQQSHGVEPGEHGLKGFLKIQAQQIVVLQHTDPAQQAHVEGAFAGAGPNGMEEADEAGGLRIKSSGGGKRPGAGAKLVLGASEGGPLPRMPAQTKVLSDGSAQFHVALIRW